jgi:predicted nucleic acid-binding protein
MILLDTNVVSEPIRRHPDSRVLDWLDAQVIETLYLSTVSLGELLSGVENLPVGRRRTALAAALERQIADLFDDRIISFDIAAAKAYAKAVARARKSKAHDFYRRWSNRRHCDISRSSGGLPRRDPVSGCGCDRHQPVDGPILGPVIPFARIRGRRQSPPRDALR